MADRFYSNESSVRINNPNIDNGNIQNIFRNIDNTITTGRVVDIVLTPNHNRFKDVGGWNGLGTIIYENNLQKNILQNPLVGPPTNLSNNFARPLFPNIKNYPLVNEIVFLINLSDTNIGKDITSKEIYYISITSLWNHPHHNGYPEFPNVPPQSQQVDYTQSLAGAVRRVTDKFTDIYLGNTFKERSNIHPLLPFEGDVIMEGRWGNSIRFGSTVKERPNNWSTTGSNGDPITILRNGQGDNRPEGWLPTVEDINKDNSSIYLTSTQKIPINVASINNYISYNSNPPQSPNVYLGKQIILNSGRLVFNTTEDHLLLSSKKSINLNSIESINFDTTSPIILQTYPVDKNGGIYLGDKDATESVLKGDLTVDLLNDLINVLIDLSKSLSQQPGVPGGSPLIMINTAGSIANDNLIKLINRLEDLKSKTVKVI
jgi:hypothetical protein